MRVLKDNQIYTYCTAGEYAFLKKVYPKLVEALGEHLFVEHDGDNRPALPVVFIFFGTERQREFWLRDKDIKSKHVRLATDPGRIQGLRARIIPVQIDPYWQPMGIDERWAKESSEWYIKDMESKVGSLYDVRNQVNPIPENERWIRLA